MNKQQIESIFRYRQTIIDNIDKIIGATKKSQKADLSAQGQLDLFSMGLEDCKSNPKLKLYDGHINLIEYVNKESELLGVPVLYDPIEDVSFMYYELYCTHNVYDILELTEQTENIVIIDRLVKIEHRTSKNGNNYCKLYFSQLGETYLYLWGQNYRNFVSSLFVNEIFIIRLTFNIPTKEFDRYNYVCTGIKNIKYVEIEEEYNRLINSLEIIDELDEEWMLVNKRCNYEKM